MNKKTYRGVIFDLDGTLLDTSEGVFASVDRKSTRLNSSHP